MPVTPLPCDCGGDGATPCPLGPVSTLGLCLADGRPIAVVHTRDCASGTVTQEGYIDLLTGIFTPGAPPAGTRACGEHLDFELTRWCDLNPDGSVIAHVLIEYEYDEETGQLVGTRLLTPLGEPYNGGNGPVGTLGNCGGDEVFQHQEILCDHRPGVGGPGGTSPATLAGTAVTPSGAQHAFGGAPVDTPLPLAQQLWDGQAINVGPGQINEHQYQAATITADPECGDLDPAGSSMVSFTVRITNTGANCGCGLWGQFSLWNGNVQLAEDRLGFLFPTNQTEGDQAICPGEIVIATIPATAVPNAALLAGDISIALNVQTGTDTTPDGNFCPTNNAGGTTYTLDQYAGTVEPVAVVNCEACPGPVVPFIRKYVEDSAGRVVDVVDLNFEGQGYNVEGYVAQCAPDTPEQTFGSVLCDTLADGTTVQFLRLYTTHDGEVIASCDKVLDGIDDYDVQGTVGQCFNNCTTCETLQLCDVRHEVSGVLPAFGVPTNDWQTLPENGVRWQRQGDDSALPNGWFIAGSTAPEKFVFDRPVEITFGVRFATADSRPLVIPEGWEVDALLVVQHAWDPATRTISPLAGVTPTGVSTFRSDPAFRSNMTAPQFTGVQPAGARSDYGQITVSADVVTPFLRTICRDCDGAVLGTPTNTLLDGTTTYNPLGEVTSCDVLPPEPSCRDCETVVLCDTAVNGSSTVTGPGGAGSGTGTLPNGVTFLARSNLATSMSPTVVNADGYWWRIVSFPHAQTSGVRMDLSVPSIVEFSVVGNHSGSNAAGENQFRIPQGAEPVGEVPEGYDWDPVASILTILPSRNPGLHPELCTEVVDPRVATSVRFRTNGPVTSLYPQYLGARIAQCGIFGTFDIGSFEITPVSPSFLRTVCRDCDGAVVLVSDTMMDGSTPYKVIGAAETCPTAVVGPVEIACETQRETVCIVPSDPQASRVVSNPGNDTTGRVDPEWTWGVTPAGGSQVFDVAPIAGAWTTPLPPGGGWVSLAADRTTGALPPGVFDYWMVTEFTLPDNALLDLTTLKIDTLNADNYVIAYSLNGGPEIPVDPTKPTTHASAAYTEPDHAIAGAVTGINRLAIKVHEDSPPSPGGVLLDVTLTYRTQGVAEYWTLERHCDGSIVYVEPDGTEHASPLSPLIGVPCAATGCHDCETVQLCDVQPGIPSDPPLSFSTVPLATLPDGPAGGTLVNGVGYTVNCGHWDSPQNHYTFYQVGSGNAPACVQTWTFDQPVYVRFGLRGLNLLSECIEATTGDGTAIDLVTASPNHLVTVTPTLAKACRTAASTALDESVFVTSGPVTQLILTGTGNGTAGRGPGLMQAALPVAAPFEPGEAVPFFRTICRDCDGNVIGTPVDTIDGSAPYEVTGTVQSCPINPPECDDCELVTLCDTFIDGQILAPNLLTADPEWIGGDPNSSRGGRLPNGVAWTWSNDLFPSGSWAGANGVGFHTINAAADGLTIILDETADVSFAVGRDSTVSSSGDRCVIVPEGSVLTDLGVGHTYDATSRTLCIGSTAATVLSRFRALDQGYLRWQADSNTGLIQVSEITVFVRNTVSFLRRVCLDCNGAVTSHTDLTLDGSAEYLTQGQVSDCAATSQGSCCVPNPICIQQESPGRLEFISNSTYANGNTAVYNGSVDPIWEWTSDVVGDPGTDTTPGDGSFGPAPGAVWYPMYRPTSYPAARWNLVDPDPLKKAGYITPHRDSGGVTTGFPGESPNVVPSWWIARARFKVPDNADPSSLRISASIFNADQYARAWRFNTGTWNPILGTNNGCPFGPGNPDACPAVNFPAMPVSGTGAGDNFLYLQIHETVVGSCCAGLIVHMNALFDYARPAQRAFTQMTCCDDTQYYIDDTGKRLDHIPAGWVQAVCSPTEYDPLVMCDATGTQFIRNIGYFSDGTVRVSDMTFTGDVFIPTDPVGQCGAPVADALVRTGVRRFGGAVSFNVKTTRPGLQSVTLTVLAGNVDASTSDGLNQTIPAGVSLTWSVDDIDDSSLAFAIFTGTSAAADWIVNYTYKDTAAG